MAEEMKEQTNGQTAEKKTEQTAEKKTEQTKETEEKNVQGEVLEEKDIRAEEKPAYAYRERKRILFLGLPFTFTKYTIDEDVITIDTGFLNMKENDCYLYKVQDVELKTSLAERIFKLGTVVCYTGDTTHPQLLIEHVKHAKEIKNYILKTSEEARRRRRTLNTLNINADEVDDLDD